MVKDQVGGGGRSRLRSIELIKPLSRTLRLGHPFVFREALKLPAGLAVGEVVDLKERGSFVARGTVDPGSALAFRVWTLDPRESVDPGLLRRRLERALSLRREILSPDVTAYRICHGENDGVPGLQCDLYGSIASMRTDGGIGLAWEERFVTAIADLVQPSAVVVRNPAREDGAARVVAGRLPHEVIFKEHSRLMAVDVIRGHKTGAFLDQRENRDRVGALARGRTVLNLFAYTGGFSLAAALGGARRVVSVDIARPAIEAAKRNFQLNRLPIELHGFEVADAFEVLEALSVRSPEFDFIVLDPPAFAPNQKSLARAKKAYMRLNELALRALPEGGWLASSSCSSHLRESEFLSLIAQAAERAGRQVTLTGVFGQPQITPRSLAFQRDTT